MAIRRAKQAQPPRTVTLDQEVGYAICRSFYANECACEKGSRDAICSTVEHAVHAAKALLLTSHKGGSNE